MALLQRAVHESVSKIALTSAGVKTRFQIAISSRVPLKESVCKLVAPITEAGTGDDKDAKGALLPVATGAPSTYNFNSSLDMSKVKVTNFHTFSGITLLALTW